MKNRNVTSSYLDKELSGNGKPGAYRRESVHLSDRRATAGPSSPTRCRPRRRPFRRHSPKSLPERGAGRPGVGYPAGSQTQPDCSGSLHRQEGNNINNKLNDNEEKILKLFNNVLHLKSLQRSWSRLFINLKSLRRGNSGSESGSTCS